MKRCGIGATLPVYWVCQKVVTSPSIAAAAEFWPVAASWLSALTAQPERDIVAPARSSRLNSAIEVHGLPVVSETASSITYCTAAPSGGVTFHASMVAVLATSLRAVTVTTNWPIVFGTPVICPFVAFRLSPVGRPVALKLSVPLGVVAAMVVDTAVPLTLACVPGLTSFGAASPETRTIFATDGTPCASIANSM